MQSQLIKVIPTNGLNIKEEVKQTQEGGWSDDELDIDELENDDNMVFAPSKPE